MTGGEVQSRLEHSNSFPAHWQTVNSSADGNTYLYGGLADGLGKTVTRKLLDGQVSRNRGLVTSVDSNYIVHHIFGTTTNDLIFVSVAYTLFNDKHYLLRSNDGGATFSQVFKFGDGNGPLGADALNVTVLNQDCFLEITREYPGGGGIGDLYIGEYNINTSRTTGGENDRVRLMKSTDHGVTWTAVMTWNTDGSNQIRHIHGVKQDPYTGYIYLWVGDSNTQSGIIRWDGASAWTDNSTPATIATWSGFNVATGTQHHRCTGLIITEHYVLTGSDVNDFGVSVDAGIWRWSKDLSSGVRVSRDVVDYDPTHVIWTGVTIGSTLIFRVCRQSSSDHHWTQPDTLIYASDDEGATWYRAGIERHEADVTGYALLVPSYTFVYDNKMYIDSFHGLDFDATDVVYISGKTFRKSESPVVVHPVYYVGDWNVVGVDWAGFGKNPDNPVATLSYLTGTGISASSRVRTLSHADIAQNGIWLSGGISAASVVAAYHSRGAANYETSKINLNNSPTHILTDIIYKAPLWTAAGGWDASTLGYLISDIVPTATMVVMFIYSGFNTPGPYFAYGSSSETGKHTIRPQSVAGSIRPQWGDYSTTTARSNLTANVIAVGPNFYWVNQTKYTFTGTWGDMTHVMSLLAYSVSGTTVNHVAQGLWPAFYIYDPAPTDAQLLAVDNALRALFP